MFQPISTFDNAQFLFRNSDVEGAEDFLFLGAEKTLKENDIAIILEIHQIVDLIKLYNFFRRLGYNALK